MRHRALVQVAALAWSLGVIALALHQLRPDRDFPPRTRAQPDSQSQVSKCLATSPSAVPNRGVRLRPGTYRLTLIATAGLRTGSSSTGILELRRATAQDRSPLTGHRPVRFNPREQLLIGSVTLDFAAVAAPIGTDDTLIPSPSSTDPVRPGVLVLMQNWQSRSAPQTPVLLIGTLGNRRDEEGWLDGPGIGLWARSIADSAFSGTWDNWGILSGGSGTFCAHAL